jgi:hypothetical protein
MGPRRSEAADSGRFHPPGARRGTSAGRTRRSARLWAALSARATLHCIKGRPERLANTKPPGHVSAVRSLCRRSAAASCRGSSTIRADSCVLSGWRTPRRLTCATKLTDAWARSLTSRSGQVSPRHSLSRAPVTAANANSVWNGSGALAIVSWSSSAVKIRRFAAPPTLGRSASSSSATGLVPYHPIRRLANLKIRFAAFRTPLVVHSLLRSRRRSLTSRAMSSTAIASRRRRSHRGRRCIRTADSYSVCVAGRRLGTCPASQASAASPKRRLGLGCTRSPRPLPTEDVVTRGPRGGDSALHR